MLRALFPGTMAAHSPHSYVPSPSACNTSTMGMSGVIDKNTVAVAIRRTSGLPGKAGREPCPLTTCPPLAGRRRGRPGTRFPERDRSRNGHRERKRSGPPAPGSHRAGTVQRRRAATSGGRSPKAQFSRYMKGGEERGIQVGKPRSVVRDDAAVPGEEKLLQGASPAAHRTLERLRRWSLPSSATSLPSVRPVDTVFVKRSAAREVANRLPVAGAEEPSWLAARAAFGDDGNPQTSVISSRKSLKFFLRRTRPAGHRSSGVTTGNRCGPRGLSQPGWPEKR